jgi:hypothetical protein
LTFGSIKKDRIFINILTVNICLKGTILSVNEYFIKWVCNKKLRQLEYIKTNLIRKIEGHKNKVTKCNTNQSKGENKAPTIINTGKYKINQFISITYQSINHFRNMLIKVLLVKSVIGPRYYCQ